MTEKNNEPVVFPDLLPSRGLEDILDTLFNMQKSSMGTGEYGKDIIFDLETTAVLESTDHV